MVELNITYHSKEKLLKVLQQKDVKLTDDKILVQMFTSLTSKEKISSIAKEVISVLPHSTLIGSSTAGEIIESHMQENSTILAISIFEKTSINAIYLREEKSFNLGVKMAQKLLKEQTKCIISFVDGLRHNGEEFLEGFSTLNTENVIIAGGMSADLYNFSNTFTIFGDIVFDGGGVGVGLCGNELEVYTDYNLGWRVIGAEFTITKSDGNHVYEIDNKPIKDFYLEVLGDYAVNNMPSSTISFPLIKIQEDTLIARDIIKVFDDESILYAGSLNEGDKVHFGVGGVDIINSYIPDLALKSHNYQACFIYSCSARKQFLGKKLEDTFAKFNLFAPASGFFTYGEFFSDSGRVNMLNVTTTLLFLNEKNTNKNIELHVKPKKLSKFLNIDNTLFHLINYITKELENKDSKLDIAKAQTNEFLNALDKILIISKTDLLGKITYANKKFEDISGYTKKELIGYPHSIVRDPDMASQTYKELWQTIKNGKIWQGELSNKAKNGEIYYTKSSIFPLYDKNHKISEYMSIREDVTMLVKSKKAYENQLMFTDMIFDNEESIIVLTKNNKLYKINETFFKKFAYKDLKSFLSWHDCICELFVEKTGYLKRVDEPDKWYETILNEPYNTHLAAMFDKDGNERIFNVKSRKIIHLDITYIINTFNDITEIEIAKELAQKAEAAQAIFLAQMSHEIRTPMNGILGFAELLADTKLNEIQKKYIDIIQNSTNTLLDIINDILDFSKLANQKIELENIDINPFIEFDNMSKLLQSLANKKLLIFTNSIDTKVFECLKTDPTRLKQIIINLLSNAIKFTSKKGHINFSVKAISSNEDYQTIRFSVKDSGIGIPKDKQQLIFKPFLQADNTTTRQFGGTGLGLSISFDLVKIFGGELKVNSKPNEGSEFYFEIRLKKCKKQYILKGLLSNFELFIISHHDTESVQILEDTLTSFALEYKKIDVDYDLEEKISPKSIVITFDKQLAIASLHFLSREQLICISDKDDDLECIDIVLDESFNSNLYNFLLTKVKYWHELDKIKNSRIVNRLNILIAEDYDVNRMLMEAIFNQYENITITFAHDGLEAVEKVRQNRYDLIFMDINMPNLNGIEATKIIREELKYKLPIIALTANVIKGDKEKFLASGMNDYMGKPIDGKKLDELIVKYSSIAVMLPEIIDDNDKFNKLNHDIKIIITKIHSNLGVDKKVAVKLLKAFTKSLESAYLELAQAFKSDSYEEILNITHKLQGSAGTLSLDKISSSAKNIENNIKNKVLFDYNHELDILQECVKLLNNGLKNAI